MYLLDFNNSEKGYKPLPVTRESFKANIGKQICYVDYIEPYRGTYFVRYGVISSVKRNTLILDDDTRHIDIKKIREAGVKEELTINNQ